MGDSPLWAGSKARFRERAARSGYKNEVPIWDDATQQAKDGRHGRPIPIPTSETNPDIRPDGFDVAFRFGVGQGEKLRALGDLKRNMVNPTCSVWAPITPPTLGHVAQSSLDTRVGHREWAFFKAGHAPAYKNLRLRSDHARMDFVALRCPKSGGGMLPPPLPLIVGEISAVLNYSCFPRILTCLANIVSGALLSADSAITEIAPRQS